MSAESHPSFWRRFWRVVFRLLLTVVLGAALGVVVYWTVPALYRQFILPVQEHSLRLDALEARQDQADQHTLQRLSDLQSRLEALEMQNDQNKQSLAEWTARLEALEAAQNAQQAQATRVQELQTNLSEMRQSLKDIQDALDRFQVAQAAIQASAQDTNDQLKTDLEELRSEQSAIRADLEELRIQVETALQAASAADAGRQSLEQNLQLLIGMESLNRARDALTQGNLGLAEADIQAARERMVGLQMGATPRQEETLSEIIAYLDEALELLPRFPTAAANRMEGAWQLMMEELPAEIAITAALIPAPITLTPTPTPIP